MTTSSDTRGWRELWRKEDWWAVWIGLGIVAAACVGFASGGSLRWLVVLPPRRSSADALLADLATNAPRYLALFLFWLVMFSVALRAMGQRLAAFVHGVALLFVAATAIFVIGQWKAAAAFNLEPPRLALPLGLILANAVRLPIRARRA